MNLDRRPTALVADDEPLLRDELVAMLSEAWPALQVVARARNGREAVALFEEHRPDVCFLDVQMPGWSGIEAARHIGARSHLVFVTAFDHYALEAFEQGVLDYVVKPVQARRLAATVGRLQERLRGTRAPLDTEALLQELAARLWRAASPPPATPAAPAVEPLRWIRAMVGASLRLIAIDDVDFLRSDEKYTLVGYRGDDGQPCEALIALPLKSLLAQLDERRFAQVHRAVVVNLDRVKAVTRGPNETAQLQLKGRPEVLPVSRSYLHLFRQM